MTDIYIKLGNAGRFGSGPFGRFPGLLAATLNAAAFVEQKEETG
jgi:hypothetical protein